MKKLLFLILISLCSCHRTELVPEPLLTETIKLANLSEREIKICPLNSAPIDRIGLQFVLFIIPAGRVYAPQLNETVERKLLQSFAEKGIRASFSCTQFPRLEFKTSSSASAYDFLVQRYLSTSIELEARMLDKHGSIVKLVSGVGESSSFNSSGFSPELSRELETSAQIACQELVDNLVLAHSLPHSGW